VGVEALVRWLHPTDGLLGADAIVEIAETHGMADALTRRVLQKALGQLQLWIDAGLRLRVAINVSMQNLAQLSFPEYVLGEVLQHGLLPPDLRLEVTESQLLRDVRVPMDILTRLRLKRIGLSIDDFGTGHSSLSQLCNLPFDELKIDRGFVHGSHERATQRAIFNASLTMAHQLDMGAVAEGVEDRADWDFVSKAGCDFAQGYFIARPMPADQIPAWHQDWMQRFRGLR
jgi:EAL domain-containing protein (putative c-di-GMP-specific phosphodiesterase class I)